MKTNFPRSYIVGEERHQGFEHPNSGVAEAAVALSARFRSPFQALGKLHEPGSVVAVQGAAVVAFAHKAVPAAVSLHRLGRRR